METVLKKEDLKEYVRRQMNTLFPDGYDFVGNDVDSAFDLALDRTEYCFEKISVRGYSKQMSDGRFQATFSHLHGDQYGQFLYYLSNSLWKVSENNALCAKVLNLNKFLNGIFCSYKAGLPDIFFLGHTIGLAIGNANYSDYLVIFHNVTINSGNESGNRQDLILGKGLFLGAGAKIIGNCPIGDRVSVGVDAVVSNREIEDDSVVIRNDHGEVIVSKRKKPTCMAQNYFNVPIQ